jgi:hypothetical protein
MHVTPIERLSKLERLVVLGGVGIHFALTLVVFGASFVLVNTGAVSVFVGLLWVIGLVCLYLAASRVAFGKAHPVWLLGVAAVCLAFSAFKFGLPYPPPSWRRLVR